MRHSKYMVLLLVIVLGCLAVPVAAQSSEPPAHDGAHIVQQGETLFSISQHYGLTVDAVAHVNGIADPRRIYVGQHLIIPDAHRKTTLQPTSPHLVQVGDTPGSIALRYRIAYQDLMFVNRMVSPNALHAGQVISVPMSSEEETGGPFGSAASEPGSIVVVHPDDTVFRIALRNGISTWGIAEANRGMDPALIFPGLELAIPGGNSDLLPVPFVDIRVQPLPVRQGEAVLIGVKTSKPVTLTGSLFGRTVPFFEEGSVYYGMVGVHVFAEPGLYDLNLSAVDSAGYVTQVTSGIVVVSGGFGYERINLPVGRRQLLDPAVISTERERLGAVIHLASPERFWNGNFQRPCAGMVSSYFGSHRSYDGGPYTSYHSGTDFRAPTGTPVVAAAGGVVVLAAPLTIHGNMVVVDHGWGVLTGYAHLSSIEVTVGQRVEKGQLLGKVGNTGQSTGAHLHWEVWVGGISVNGLQWLDTSFIEGVFDQPSGNDVGAVFPRDAICQGSPRLV